MAYTAPVEEFKFLLDHVAGFAGVNATDRFAEATPDMTAAILSEAGRLCEDVLAPLRRIGDAHPARLENGVVRMPPSHAEAYRAIAEGGWVGLAAPTEHGGMGLPQTLNAALHDMMSGACLALEICPLLTQGQIEALVHHAAPELQAIYLPRLTAGEWTGTMNLTEPQAGTDVGAVATRATPRDDGSYAITGQKIYISYGDHDMADNVCHLVLARLPDAPPGTKGLSLFLVPRRVPDADGRAGVSNAVHVGGIEHKMGLHASPTCTLRYEDATGWLVGAPDGGIAAMFTMMNNARLGVGVQGVGVAEAAYQQALAFASERRQGTPPGGPGPIADHPDIRRTLVAMRADVFAARAIALACAVAIDMEAATGAADWTARAALLTPIAKAFGTDTGIRVADAGIQVHGGMGYVEETGAAQYLRDIRVSAIYEGTNGIQAMDLVGRKLADGGEAAFAMIGEVQEAAEAARGALPDLAGPVWEAAEALRETTEWLAARSDIADRFAGATPYLRAFARVLGAHFHLTAAMAEGAAGPRTALAHAYVRRLLPEHLGCLAEARAGAGDLFAPELAGLTA